ncbi:uncharacterized protein AB675_2880 [Cyphellophora attinorum]|uniref:Uncharacterized protein n=1 Tax=Cyphellophora attinorum TaxID=1664694 RepID=A0A0N0NRQ2_9EURO|nr:uncharacterized protein AB675_2880 [Phialophora attinorum]KPI45361.1 hypothetical protein AB675_2880 [Phialophora attinorum]
MNPKYMRPPPQLYFQPLNVYDYPTPIMTRMYQPVVQVQYSYAPLPEHNPILAQHTRVRHPATRQSEPQIRWFRTDTGENIEEPHSRSRNHSNRRGPATNPPLQPTLICTMPPAWVGTVPDDIHITAVGGGRVEALTDTSHITGHAGMGIMDVDMGDNAMAAVQEGQIELSDGFLDLLKQVEIS